MDLETERGLLAAILQRNLPYLDHEGRFEWRYMDNPAGRAWSWFVCSGKLQDVVGVASVFPKHFWVGGELVLGGQVGDFAIEKSHRSLGPATLLQRTTLGPVQEGHLRFVYDCPPHDSGMATFNRMGLESACTLTRYVKPLRIDGRLRSRIPGGLALQAPVTRIANALILLRDSFRRGPRDITVEEFDEDFGDEFTDLDQSYAPRSVIRARRNAEELNWRLRSEPCSRYTVLVARSESGVLGFIAYTESERRLRIVDLFCPTASGRVALLHEVVVRSRKSGCAIVDAIAVQHSNEESMLRGAGYRAREPAGKVVVYESHGMTGGRAQSYEWNLTSVDVMA